MISIGLNSATIGIMGVNSFHDLHVWRLSMQLAADIYRLSLELPSEERFGLSQQMRRAAVSIPSNIAEGAGYGKSRRNVHHIRVALGSDLELQTQLLLIEQLKFTTSTEVEPVLDRACEVGRMLNGLIKSLKRNHAASNL